MKTLSNGKESNLSPDHKFPYVHALKDRLGTYEGTYALILVPRCL